MEDEGEMASRGTMGMVAVIASLVLGCGGNVVVDGDADGTSEDSCAPPTEMLGSLEAASLARCATADRPELVLFWMQNGGQYAVSMDGVSGWSLRYADPDDPSNVIVVHVTPDGIALEEGSAPAPCLEAIAPFDAAKLVSQALPVLPAEIGGAEYITLHIRKTAPCAPYWSDEGRAVLRASTEAELGIHFFGYDETDTLMSQCGPCDVSDPSVCGCGF